jgi:lactate racemase
MTVRQDSDPRRRYRVPYGQGYVNFTLPDRLDGDEVHTMTAVPLVDPPRAAEAALANPIGSPDLCALAVGKQSVCIAVTDATRACPDHILVPPMLRALKRAGVSDEAITILVAVGAHRASKHAEKVDKLGPEIVSRYRVSDHDATDEGNLVPVMTGPGGLPFQVNRVAVESDLLLSTGLVEPHQYAGYSGGGKTVAIGCGDEAAIAYTHGPSMLDLDGTRLAQLDGNPFQSAVRAVSRAAGLAFVANAVLDQDGQILKIAYGDPIHVHDSLAAFATPVVTAPIETQYDVAIAGVGHPKDANLYQASRAASYLQFAPTPVVRKGGVIIVPAACPEGAGLGAGEQRFFAAMSQSGGRREVIDRARREGIRPGEQRAYVMSRVLENVDVIVAGMHDAAIARAAGFEVAGSIDDALRAAMSRVGTPARVLIVPHALHTLPVVTRQVKVA